MIPINNNIIKLFKLAETHINSNDILKYINLKILFEDKKRRNEFCKKFKSYYGLNQGGLSKKQLDIYFEALFSLKNIKNYEKNFKSLIKKLYRLPRKKGDHSVQCSFISKLLSFIDESYPIYDKYVGKFFGIIVPLEPTLEFKINIIINNMMSIKENYELWLSDQRLKKIIQRIKNKYGINCHNIRIIDFLIYVIGKKKLF